MISATAAACGSSGVDRSVASSPSTTRFNDASNDATRTSVAAGADGTQAGTVIKAFVVRLPRSPLLPS